MYENQKKKKQNKDISISMLIPMLSNETNKQKWCVFVVCVWCCCNKPKEKKTFY